MERLLAVLLRSPTTPKYAYDVSQEAGLPRGSIYAMLRRMERAGWVESEWERVDPAVELRPPRRYYRLTPAGERVAWETVRDTRAHLRGLRRVQPGLET
jgi:DNA-binding PadR family transcriptional regulator